MRARRRKEQLGPVVDQQIDEEQDEPVVVEQQIDKEQDETVVVEQQIDEEQDEPTKTQTISLQNCILKLNITFYKV